MFGQTDSYHAASDARLGSMLQERLEAGHSIIALKPEHLDEVSSALDAWAVVQEPSLAELTAAGQPALQVTEAFSVVLAERDGNHQLPGKRLSVWSAEQQALGRAVFIRGNPLPPLRASLEAYATAYLDVHLSADNPGWMMVGPAGWLSADDLAQASDVELALKNYPLLAVAIGVSVVGVAAAILYYALRRAK